MPITPFTRVGRRSHLVLSTMVLAGWLATGPALGPSARADLVGCRSDPVVVLSNGVTLDLSADIDDIVGDVQQVSYTLHIPAGTFPLAVIGTDGLMGLKESFAVSADGAPNTYATDTVVKTLAPGVGVVATTAAVARITIGKASATGQTPQHLQVSFST
jgi:hypothetical protein